MNTDGTEAKRVVLTFSGPAAERPIISELIKKYDLLINIYRARITQNEEGYMAIDITGTKEKLDAGLKYIASLGINIDETGNSLVWDMDKCVGCGNCITHCPTGALYIADSNTREIKFNGEKCIECLSCIRNCPFGACTSLF